VSDAEDRLMRYFDGELEAEEAAEVERLIAESADARALLADFERVGSVVRAIADQHGARGDGIADRVMAELNRPPPGVRSVPAGNGQGPRGRLIPFAPAIGLGLAAAAAVALLVRPHPPHGNARGSVSAVVSVLVPSPSVVPSEEAEVVEPDTGASIETVDFGAQNGSIFMVASGPQVTPVVWLVDESDESGDKMEPL
jgi:anti-sigma factor RsiW